MGIGGSFKGQSRVYKEFDIEDRTFTEKEAVIWLDKGSVPQVLFLNGSGKPRNVIRAIPVNEISIEGPLDVEWPPRTYKVTYHSEDLPDFSSNAVRRKILNNFISRAFRRNVSSAEQDKYYKYLELEYEKDKNWQEALRLSYFLWSTMPDIELFRLAHSGKLLEPEVYKGQVQRLLLDPRAKEFSESFASQWLSIDQLGEMRPSEDDKKYGVYFRDRLEESMRKETLMFFNHILFENRPITDFLDSDYTFLNEPLAKLYGVPFQKTGDRRAMKMVKLPANSVRGGLPPAPEEVPALVPDLTGVDTPRAQLDRHREDPKCFSCHQLMDPPGLALESFDIIGRYRKDYGGKKTRINASGEYRGTKFSDIRGLRKALLKSKQTFLVNFIARIAEYAKVWALS